LMAVSDRVTVLRGGRLIGTVETTLTSPSELARMMVGREVVFAESPKARDMTGGEIVLELRGVSADGDMGIRAVNDVSLAIRAGEIVGIAGVSGNGQRQLAEAISGARSRTAGDVLASGHRLRNGDPEDAIVRGVAHVPEDRLGTGVSPSLSVADNLILKSHRQRPIATRGLLRGDRIAANARDLMARFSIAAPGPETPTRLLSGGNVQKVVLARELSSRPRSIVAANPTRGLDVGATESVRALLLKAAADGVGILLISEDLDEILTLADRIAVIYEGHIVGVVPRDEADVQQIGLMMAGASAASRLPPFKPS
jgi:ABC-type uncharacterized transport system ATPase subunit